MEWVLFAFIYIHCIEPSNQVMGSSESGTAADCSYHQERVILMSSTVVAERREITVTRARIAVIKVRLPRFEPKISYFFVNHSKTEQVSERPVTSDFHE